MNRIHTKYSDKKNELDLLAVIFSERSTTQFALKLIKFKWFQQTLGGYWSEPGTFVRSLDQLFGSRGPLGAPKWP